MQNNIKLYKSLIFSCFIHFFILFFILTTKKLIINQKYISIPIEIINISTINGKKIETIKPKIEIKKVSKTKKNTLQNIENKNIIKDKKIKTIQKNSRLETKENNINKTDNDTDNDIDDEILNLSNEIKKTKNIKNLKQKNILENIKFEKNFKFTYYAKIITKKISENWEKPFISTSNAKVIIYFKILRNGEIIDIKIHEKSSFENFNNSTINAIKKIKNFPPLPEEYEKNELGVFFSFEFI